MASVISKDARIGTNFKIGFGSQVHGNVEIGDDVTIGDFCIIGSKARSRQKSLSLGGNSLIRSHCVIYEGAQIGAGFETGHHVIIREQSTIGPGTRIGSHSDIEGYCNIGKHCRLHSYVHIGQGTDIGNYVFIYSLTTTLNDPLPPSHIVRPSKIGDGSVLAFSTTVLPGSNLGLGCFAAQNSIVNGVYDIGSVISGSEGHKVGSLRHLIDMQSGTRHPWFSHFKSGLPDECHTEIDELAAKINSAIGLRKAVDRKNNRR